MSFLRKFSFGFRGGDAEHLKVLEQAIGLLRLSVFYTLQKKYVPRFGVEKAGALAVAVVSRMILEAPGDERLVRFCERNRKEISEEALKAHGYEDLCGPSGCASYLYAAEILHAKMVKASSITDATKKWKSSQELQEQAAHLSIPVPCATEICGSNDRNKCIEAIHSFAKAFYYTNTWTGTSPAITEVSLPSIPFDYGFLAKVLLERDDPEAAVEPEAKDQPDEVAPAYQLRANHH